MIDDMDLRYNVCALLEAIFTKKSSNKVLKDYGLSIDRPKDSNKWIIDEYDLIMPTRRRNIVSTEMALQMKEIKDRGVQYEELAMAYGLNVGTVRDAIRKVEENEEDTFFPNKI